MQTSCERLVTLDLPKKRDHITLPFLGEKPLGTTVFPNYIDNPKLIFLPGEIKPVLDAGGFRMKGWDGSIETVGKLNEQIFFPTENDLNFYRNFKLAEEDLSIYDPEQLKEPRIENLSYLAHFHIPYPVEVLDEKIISFNGYVNSIRLRWFIRGWHDGDRIFDYFFDHTRRHNGFQGKETVVDFNLTNFNGQLQTRMINISQKLLTFPTCPSSLFRLPSSNGSLS